MNSLITPPEFFNTRLRRQYLLETSGSHKDEETLWLMENIITDKPFGVVSTGNAAISLAKLVKDSHIFVPKDTPLYKIKILNELTENVHIIGKDYAECYEISDSYMERQGIVNVTAGKVDRYLGNCYIADEILKTPIPDYVFVPASNLDLAVGLAKRFNERNTATVVIACVLPNHPKSPRFNYKFDKTLYSSCITYDGYNIPALNKYHKVQGNLSIATVKNPDWVYRKYKDLYPELDPVCYIAMECSEKFLRGPNKMILLTGANRNEK